MDGGGVARQALDELLPERLERLRKVTGVPVVFGGVTRTDAEGMRMPLGRLIGTAGDALHGLVVRPGRGLGGYVWRRRAPLRVRDYLTTMAITHDYDQAVLAERLTSVFAVPVLVRGDVGGVLYGAVRDRHPIGDRTVRSATVVAEQMRRDVESRLDRGAGETGRRPRGALAELAAVIRDTRDPGLRARLVRIQQDLSGRPARAGTAPVLAPREIDVLRLVDAGASNLEAAVRLGLSQETVKAYLRSAMRKLDVHNRTAAAYRARLDGLL